NGKRKKRSLCPFKLNELSTKKGGPTKRKKEAKKEKRISMWETPSVSHMLMRQTSNKLFNPYL
ncbi:hypothetical protein ACFFGT_00005, partial [Mucilaginibacter angelicae]